MGITNVYEKTEAQMTTKEKLERDKGLVLHLDFSTPYSADNLILDKSGNNNHATVVPSTTPVWVENGVIGKGAYSFDGSNDYVRVENNIITSPTELTIAAWFNKQGEGSNYECVIHRGTDNSIGNTEFWLGVSANDFLTATIGARAGVGWAAGETAVKVVLNRWYHLAATWDGTTVRVYIDGEFNKSYALASYSNANSPTRLGASNDGTAYQYNGLIDDVRIYSTALSASEVKELYQTRATVDEGGNLSVMGVNYGGNVVEIATNGVLNAKDFSEVGITDGLVAWYPLDGNARDYTMNRQDGTVNGASVAEGLGQGCYSFDGVDDYIATNAILVPSTVFTLSAWVNHTSANYIGIVEQYQSGINGRFTFRLYQNKIYVLFGDSSANYLGANTLLAQDTWNHVTMVRDSNNDISLYNNGIKDVNTYNNSIEINQSLPTKIGGNYQPFAGRIEDVRIYNRALTPEEIKILYDLTKNKKTSFTSDGKVFIPGQLKEVY